LKDSFTFENQFVFQNPGVPHGHFSVPPLSIQSGFAKSFENQKSIARAMAARRSELFTHWDAEEEETPPWNAADMATDQKGA
jgi:hypothetical protein